MWGPDPSGHTGANKADAPRSFSLAEAQAIAGIDCVPGTTPGRCPQWSKWLHSMTTSEMISMMARILTITVHCFLSSVADLLMTDIIQSKLTSVGYSRSGWPHHLLLCSVMALSSLHSGVILAFWSLALIKPACCNSSLWGTCAYPLRCYCGSLAPHPPC